MIKDLLFVVRMLGLAVLVALALQTRIGEKTMEETLHHWLKTTVFVDYIQEAVDGGVALTKAGYKSADTGVRKVLAKLSKRREGKKERGLNIELKRYNADQEDDEDLGAEDMPAAAPAAKAAIPKVQ